MTYGDYFHYAGPPDFRALNDTLERRDRESWISDLSEGSQAGRELAARLFTTRVAATADAPGAPGRFPVLLYAAGRGSRADANVELGEYLASHGYIVATVPRLGPSDVNLELGSSPGEALLHEKDLDFAWAILRQLSSVDTTSVSIAGHSAGGIVAMQFGMTHSGIAAVIGLDASYGMRGEERAGSAVRSRAEEFPDFEPAHLTAAVLDLRRAAGVQGAVLDSSVVAALTASDRYVVTMSRMYHGDFTEFAPIAVSLGLPWVTAADGRTRQTGLAGNEHAYRAVLEFLEAKVRHAAGALDTMSADLHPLNGVMLVHRPPEKAIR